MNKTPFLLIGALAMTGCSHIVGSIVSGQRGPHITGSGHSKTETRKVGSFSKVRSEGSVDVVATIGGRSDLKVTADDNLLKLIKTRVEGDTLLITSEGSYSTKNKLEVSFSTPSLRSVDVEGSSDVTVKGLKGGDFEASIAGSGDITATGSVNSLSASITGSGDISFAGVQAKTASVSISGSGDARVNVTSSLSATINGSGDVTYTGNPRVSKSINGSGDVHRG